MSGEDRADSARWVQPERPLPVPTQDDVAFFEAASHSEFVLQRCAACGLFRHTPRPICPACHSLEHLWQRASGQGAVYTWTVVHGPTLPAFEAELPYVVIDVHLDEGPHMIGRLRDCPPADVRAGMRVEAVFEPGDDGIMLVAWRQSG